MRRLFFISLIAAAIGMSAWIILGARPKTVKTGAFLELPYLQLGDNPKLGGDAESLALLWQTSSSGGRWSVELHGGSEPAKAMATPSVLEVKVPGTPTFYLWQTSLTGLKPGADNAYTVHLDGKEVFQAKAKARTPRDKAYKFVVWGDAGANTPEQKEIAYLAHEKDPSFVFITGDIVYGRGLVHEYRENHFPIYNADKADRKVGAPMLRSIPFIAAPGNHDLRTRDLGSQPDALGYFTFWRQPMNGPESAVFGRLEGPEDRVNAFRKSNGGTFPRMANFSFDWGNSHWLVLDTNEYADWTDAALQKWIADDLASAKDATWRFVGFHHPGFNSSKAHFKDQQARVLSRVFEAGGVDVVFAGHVHNYQRSFPLKFEAGTFDLNKSREVNGTWKLDKKYDGKNNTKPEGIIYLVTGAGGNRLYNEDQDGNEGSWQEFTTKFVSKIHSLTWVEIDDKKARFQQLDRKGKVVDEFVVTK